LFFRMCGPFAADSLLPAIASCHQTQVIMGIPAKSAVSDPFLLSLIQISNVRVYEIVMGYDNLWRQE
jgi:hypothetical protein